MNIYFSLINENIISNIKTMLFVYNALCPLQPPNYGKWISPILCPFLQSLFDWNQACLELPCRRDHHHSGPTLPCPLILTTSVSITLSSWTLSSTKPVSLPHVSLSPTLIIFHDSFNIYMDDLPKTLANQFLGFLWPRNNLFLCSIIVILLHDWTYITITCITSKTLHTLTLASYLLWHLIKNFHHSSPVIIT